MAEAMRDKVRQSCANQLSDHGCDRLFPIGIRPHRLWL